LAMIITGAGTATPLVTLTSTVLITAANNQLTLINTTSASITLTNQQRVLPSATGPLINAFMTLTAVTT
jgi:hypothetical protein